LPVRPPRHATGHTRPGLRPITCSGRPAAAIPAPKTALL